MKPDGWDVTVIVGALLVAVGWWFVWPPAVAFWLGALLMLAGVMIPRR